MIRSLTTAGIILDKLKRKSSTESIKASVRRIRFTPLSFCTLDCYAELTVERAVADRGQKTRTDLDFWRLSGLEQPLSFARENLSTPFNRILDEEGNRLTIKNTGDLEEGDHRSREKLLFLNQYLGPPMVVLWSILA